jgi:hypothetical protein
MLSEQQTTFFLFTIRNSRTPSRETAQPLDYDNTEELSGLALLARKLKLTLDLLAAQKGRVTPSLRDDCRVRVYE